MNKITYIISGAAIALALMFNVNTTRAQSPTGPTGEMPFTTESMTRNTDMDRDDILVEMTALHTQHTDLMAEAMRKQYTNAPDFEAARDALNQNAQQIGMIINAQLNEQARTLFSNYWDTYTQYLLQYAEGLRSNDTAMQNNALVGLHRNIISASEMMATEREDVSRQEVDEILRTHVNLMRVVIEAYDEGQYTDSYDAQIRAQEQISQVAKMITDQMEL